MDIVGSQVAVGATLTAFNDANNYVKQVSPTLKKPAAMDSEVEDAPCEQVHAEMQLDELLRGLSEQQAMTSGDFRALTPPASIASSAGCPPSANHSFSFSNAGQVDSPMSSPNPSDTGDERVEEPATDPACPEALDEVVVPVKERPPKEELKKTYTRESRLTSSEDEIPDGVRLPQRKGGMHLWQFLYAMLRDRENRYANLIEWTRNEKDLEFRLLEPEAIAVWWGHHKNKSNMSYDKLSRSLRYYYDKGIIRKINGERYVYRFCIDPELMYKHIGNSENRPQLKPMPDAAKRAMSQFQSNGSEYGSHAGSISSPKVPLVAQEADLLQGRCRKRMSPDHMSYQTSNYPSYYHDYRTMYEQSSYAHAGSYPPEPKRSNSVDVYTHPDPFAPYAGSTIYYQRECISLPSYSFASQIDPTSYPHYPPICNSPELITMSTVSTLPENTTTSHLATGASVPLASTSSDDSLMSTYSPPCTSSLSPSVNEVFPMFSSSTSCVSATNACYEARDTTQLENSCIASPSLVEDNYLFASLVPAASTGVVAGSYQWPAAELVGAEFDLNLLNN